MDSRMLLLLQPSDTVLEIQEMVLSDRPCFHYKVGEAGVSKAQIDLILFFFFTWSKFEVFVTILSRVLDI